MRTKGICIILNNVFRASSLLIPRLFFEKKNVNLVLIYVVTIAFSFTLIYLYFGNLVDIALFI